MVMPSSEMAALAGATVVILTAGGSVTIWVATMIADKVARRMRDEITGTPDTPSLMLPMVEGALAKFQTGFIKELNGRYIWRRECELQHTETERRLIQLEGETRD